ncbi:MAG: M28 family peptidase [Bacteroidales bacterium]|nr:M28 family peptidase [Bacteroidales bacterium]
MEKRTDSSGKKEIINRFFMRRIVIGLVFLLGLISGANSQDIKYVRKQLGILCGPEFHGRGYYKNGDRIAAEHLAGEFKKAGLQKFGPDYFQEYSFNVNSLEEVSFKINGEDLVFGDDYMMNATSGSSSGLFKPLIIDAGLMRKPDSLLGMLREKGPDNLVVIDSAGLNNRDLFSFLKALLLSDQHDIAGLIEVYSKTPGCRVGRDEMPWPYVQLNRKALPSTLKSIELNIENKYYDHYTTRNVIGFIPGQTNKTIVYTAHYDGMGSFGEGNYFPGASDNASGTCMVLDLARHLSLIDKPYYSYVFMLFSGEEAGLMGSRHYAENPLFPLENIKLVVNLDMVGTGQNGVLLFNGPQRPLEAAIVQKINEQKGYMKEIIQRNGSANSDHWPFHLKNVPAIFFLTTGRAGGGHNIFDTADKLPLYAYENLFRLVLGINKELHRQETE